MSGRRSGTAIKTGELQSEVEEGSNILLLSPTMESTTEEACATVSTHHPLDQTDLLTVTLSQSPDQRLDAWHTHAGSECPAKTTIVTAGDGVRSAAAQESSPIMCTGSFMLDTVPDPGSLVDLGVVITEYLSEWADDGNHTVVCFHSVTDLLQYVEEFRGFRFLHALIGRTQKFDATAHYHLDPSAHDDETVAKIADPMDATVEYEGSDSWIVNR